MKIIFSELLFFSFCIHSDFRIMRKIFSHLVFRMFDNFNLLATLQMLPAIVIGLTVHEFAHAYAAYKCGDYTAKEMGRLSLNPLRHIDPIGFALIVFVGFGWAKPVAFNEYHLKNKDADTIKIAAAGPLSNAVLAIIFSGIFVLIAKNIPETALDAYSFFIGMLYYGIIVNWGLFVFNLIPLPPLDGSHVFLSRCKNHPSYRSLEKW